jgi:hypothetical protein
MNVRAVINDVPVMGIKLALDSPAAVMDGVTPLTAQPATRVLMAPALGHVLTNALAATSGVMATGTRFAPGNQTDVMDGMKHRYALLAIPARMANAFSAVPTSVLTATGGVPAMVIKPAEKPV